MGTETSVDVSPARLSRIKVGPALGPYVTNLLVEIQVCSKIHKASNNYLPPQVANLISSFRTPNTPCENSAMGKASDALKAIIEDLPDHHLSGFTGGEHTLHRDKNYRLDIQGVRCLTQSQVTKHTCT